MRLAGGCWRRCWGRQGPALGARSHWPLGPGLSQPGKALECLERVLGRKRHSRATVLEAPGTVQVEDNGVAGDGMGGHRPVHSILLMSTSRWPRLNRAAPRTLSLGPMSVRPAHYSGSGRKYMVSGGGRDRTYTCSLTKWGRYCGCPPPPPNS